MRKQGKQFNPSSNIMDHEYKGTVNKSIISPISQEALVKNDKLNKLIIFNLTNPFYLQIASSSN